MTYNVMTQYLGDTRLYKYRKPSSRWGVHPQAPHAGAMLELAKERLGAMDFVGLASRFPESMALLRCVDCHPTHDIPSYVLPSH